MINSICDEFKNNITDVINNCGLPPVIAYYILKDSLHELEEVSKDAIQYEKREEEQRRQEQIEKIQKEDMTVEEAE